MNSSSMRHAEGLLPKPMTVAPLGRALVPTAGFAAPFSVSQLPAVRAIALPAIVAQADPENPAAPEAFDLEEIDRIRVRHAAGEADLDKSRRECEALSVCVVELPPRCVDSPVALAGAAGHCRLARRQRNVLQAPLRASGASYEAGRRYDRPTAAARGPDTRDRVGGR